MKTSRHILASGVALLLAPFAKGQAIPHGGVTPSPAPFGEIVASASSTAVPEPVAAALALAGFASLLGLRRRVR